MDSTLGQLFFFLFFFFATVAFALLINSILLRFVKTLGTKNQPGASVRWSTHTKPAIGGLSFFIVFFISFSIYSLAFDSRDVFENLRIVGLMAAGTLGFLMGLTDDAYNTRPVLKLLAQILCGCILAGTGSSIELFDSYIINAILTVIWVVGIMNAINLLDNMDGIAASVASIVVLAALINLLLFGKHQSVDFTLLIGVLAALLGFLFFNWNPSSMFMGDTGSQFLGVILAYVGVRYCWNAQSIEGAYGLLTGVAALVTVFIMPIIDTTVVTVHRLKRGQSPMKGGKDHTTHHLSYLGYSDRQVGSIFVGISLLGALAYTLLIAFALPGKYLLAGIMVLCFIALLLYFYFLIEKNQKDGRNV